MYEYNAPNGLVFDGETFLVLQGVDHGGEEEPVLDQLGQTLAGLIKLYFNPVLIQRSHNIMSVRLINL